MMRRLRFIPFLVLALLPASCADQRSHAQAIYMLVDTSGTYSQELDKAQRIVSYLLGTLKSGDSLAVARVKSRSFSEKDIIAKATFTKDPMPKKYIIGKVQIRWWPVQTARVF